VKKAVLVVGFFFVIICGLMIVLSPDSLTRVFVVAQSILMLLGYIFGIFRVSQYSSAFQSGRAMIYRTKQEVKTDDLWLALARNDEVFFIEDLDKDFDVYKKLVSARKKNPYGVLPDIEDTFNEDSISLKIWRGAVNQVPETLTGIGILGTFIGLIIGIGSIGFSSVEAAITSLKVMIDGIEIAFFTSIAGIIFSIIFNLTYKFVWNILLRNLNLFIEDFHKNVIPSEETQMKELQVKYYSTVLMSMNQEPKA